MKNKPILVTGIHRSGSTFTGKILSLDKKICYIQEPFNKTTGLDVIDCWFKYLKDDNITKEYKETLNKLIQLNRCKYKLVPFDKSEEIKNRFELMKNLKNNFSLKNFTIGLGSLLFRSKSQLLHKKAQLNIFKERILIKDPIACLSSQYLHEQFDMDVVILIRHPLGFIGSIKRLGWSFDFNDFLIQEDLMTDYLYKYEKEIKFLASNKGTIVEQGVLLWLCIYDVLIQYLDKNPRFIVAKHEDICEYPLESFKNLYAALSIEFTNDIEKRILEHTSKKNPTKVKDNKAHHDLKRNSQKLIKSWESYLTDKEVDYIKNRTYSLASRFYKDSSWRL